MAWWIWIFAGLVVGGSEGVASLGGTSVDLWLQLALFSLLAVAGMLLFRRRLVNALGARHPASPPIDAIEGQEARLIDPLPAGAVGKAELRGAVWNVRNAGDVDLAGGTRCRVESVDGLTLIVKG